MKEQLQRAIHAAKGGHTNTARRMLLQVLKKDPGNEVAWLWLASVVKDERRRQALERVLEINPKNELATRELAKAQEPQIESSAANLENTKKCPYCAENVKAEAVVCRFCGRDLGPSGALARPASVSGKKSRASRGRGCVFWTLIAIGGFMLFALMLSYDDNDVPRSPTRSRPTFTESNYRSVDVRELDSYTNRYRGDYVKLDGEVFNIVSDGLQIWVRKPGGDEWDTVAVAVTWDYNDVLPSGVYEDTMITVYGRVEGSMSGTNAFGAEISQPLIVADRIVRLR